MLPKDLEKMIEGEILHRYSDLKIAEDSASVVIGAIKREMAKQRKDGGIDAIKMISSEEGWEESEIHYLSKWEELQKQF
jgi:molybdopterin synthase catalytic subunit